jgi:ubiquitin-activating enzyme E1 C
MHAQGHARVIMPGFTPCFQCTMWLFPPQTKFPLCTLADTPRTAAHCIEYAHLIAWGTERGGDSFDADDPDHMKWVYDVALLRSEQFGIPGVTLSHTQGVVKNIIPAIPSTNAIVAAACALEVLKMATMCATGMQNCMMCVRAHACALPRSTHADAHGRRFNGTRGVYTHTVAYDRDPACVVCGAGVPVAMPAGATLAALLEVLLARFPEQLSAPSVSFGSQPLYVRGVFEEETRPNLARTLAELLQEAGADMARGVTLHVNDKKMPHGALRVRLTTEQA